MASFDAYTVPDCFDVDRINTCQFGVNREVNKNISYFLIYIMLFEKREFGQTISKNNHNNAGNKNLMNKVKNSTRSRGKKWLDFLLMNANLKNLQSEENYEFGNKKFKY